MRGTEVVLEVDGGVVDVVLGALNDDEEILEVGREGPATQYQLPARRPFHVAPTDGFQASSCCIDIPKDCSIRKQLSPVLAGYQPEQAVVVQLCVGPGGATVVDVPFPGTVTLCPPYQYLVTRTHEFVYTYFHPTVGCT